MTGRGIVSRSPSLLSGMPKRAPVAAGDGEFGQSVQSSPLLVLRLNTWRILIGDLRLFLVLLVRPAGFFESALHSLVFLLLLWRITSVSIHYIYHFQIALFCSNPIRNLLWRKLVWLSVHRNSIRFCTYQSKAQTDLSRFTKCEIYDFIRVGKICHSIWSLNEESLWGSVECYTNSLTYNKFPTKAI